MLNIKNLSVYYGAAQAINNVSLDVKAGEIVALIGANGAGKSTLLDTISGLKAPKAGSIRFDDKDITGHNPETIVRRGLIQVPEGRELFPALTVYENLMMGAYMIKDRNLIKNNVEVVFDLFPVLEDRAKNLAQTLSGGEQQMLAVSRALMSNPKLLILDEPSLGIAPILVEEIFKVIKRLNGKGLAILLVEQNVFLSLKISNRGYVLERGEIVLEGPADEMIKNPEVEKSYLGI